MLSKNNAYLKNNFDVNTKVRLQGDVTAVSLGM